MNTILTSKLNPRFRFYESLNHSKGLRENAQFLVMGRKLVPELVQAGHTPILEEIRTAEMPSVSAAPQVILAPELFHKVDSQGTDFPILLVNQARMDELDPQLPPIGVEIVAPLGNPQNLGATLRSAAAFGASRVLLPPAAAHPFLPTATRASSLSSLLLPLQRVSSMDRLAGPLFALQSQSKNSVDIREVKFPKNLRLLVGEEGQGVPEGIHAQQIHIPMRKVESLNAAVAISLALYLIDQQHGEAKHGSATPD